jgi:hypothetical protein
VSRNPASAGEGWKDGRMKKFDNSTIECWNDGMMESWKNLAILQLKNPEPFLKIPGF